MGNAAAAVAAKRSERAVYPTGAACACACAYVWSPLFSFSGEGKPRMLDEKETTVYKRALDMAYHLKIKASRAVYGEVRGTPGWWWRRGNASSSRSLIKA